MKNVLLLCMLMTVATQAAAGCLASGNGFLRARVGGALNLDIDWRDAELECEGSPRPDGNGIRLSFAGPLRSDGRRMRMVFGVGSTKEGQSGTGLPTNLTVMFEGEQRLFATRGDDRCTIDELEQERIGDLGGPIRSYRVIGRGFCVAPASSLNGDERIVVSRFDFAGRTTFEDDIVDLSNFPRATLQIKSKGKRHQFDVWVAQTPVQQAQGLMFVNDLAPNSGMLFPQAAPRDAGMWMKNTFISLDMLFVDARGTIVKIAERTEPHSLQTIKAGTPVMAVLELKGGEVERRGIKKGDRVIWKTASSSARVKA